MSYTTVKRADGSAGSSCPYALALSNRGKASTTEAKEDGDSLGPNTYMRPELKAKMEEAKARKEATFNRLIGRRTGPTRSVAEILKKPEPEAPPPVVNPVQVVRRESPTQALPIAKPPVTSRRPAEVDVRASGPAKPNPSAASKNGRGEIKTKAEPSFFGKTGHAIVQREPPPQVPASRPPFTGTTKRSPELDNCVSGQKAKVNPPPLPKYGRDEVNTKLPPSTAGKTPKNSKKKSAKKSKKKRSLATTPIGYGNLEGFETDPESDLEKDLIKEVRHPTGPPAPVRPTSSKIPASDSRRSPPVGTVRQSAPSHEQESNTAHRKKSKPGRGPQSNFRNLPLSEIEEELESDHLTAVDDDWELDSFTGAGEKAEESEDKLPSISHSEENGDLEADYSSDFIPPSSDQSDDGSALQDESTQDPSPVHEELKSATKPPTPRKTCTNKDDRPAPKLSFYQRLMAEREELLLALAEKQAKENEKSKLKPPPKTAVEKPSKSARQSIEQTTRRQSADDIDPVTGQVPTTKKERKHRSSKKSAGRNSADAPVKSEEAIDDIQPSSRQHREDEHLSSSSNRSKATDLTPPESSEDKASKRKEHHRHRKHHSSKDNESGHQQKSPFDLSADRKHRHSRKSSKRNNKEAEVSLAKSRSPAEENSIQPSAQIESEDSLVQAVSIEDADASSDVPSPPSDTGSKTQDLSAERRHMDGFDNLSSTISDISLSQATEQLTPSYSDSEACKSDQEQSQREDFQSHLDSGKEEYSEVNQLTEPDAEEQSEDRFTISISHSEEAGNHEPDYSSDPRTPTSGSLADGAALHMEEDEPVLTLAPAQDPSPVHEELKSASKPPTPRKSSAHQDDRHAHAPKPVLSIYQRLMAEHEELLFALAQKQAKTKEAENSNLKAPQKTAVEKPPKSTRQSTEQTTRRQSTDDIDPVTDQILTTRKERKHRSSKKSSKRSGADAQASCSRSAEKSNVHTGKSEYATDDIQPFSRQHGKDEHLSSSSSKSKATDLTPPESSEDKASKRKEDHRRRKHHTSKDNDNGSSISDKSYRSIDPPQLESKSDPDDLVRSKSVARHARRVDAENRRRHRQRKLSDECISNDEPGFQQENPVDLPADRKHRHSRKSSRRSSKEAELSLASSRSPAEETSIQLSAQIESEDSLVQAVSIEETDPLLSDVPSPPLTTGSKTQDLSAERRHMDGLDNLSSTISDISLSQATEQLTPSYSEACKSDQEQSQREDFQSHPESSKEEYSEVNQITEQDAEEQSEDRHSMSSEDKASKRKEEHRRRKHYTSKDNGSSISDKSSRSIDLPQQESSSDPDDPVRSKSATRHARQLDAETRRRHRLRKLSNEGTSNDESGLQQKSTVDMPADRKHRHSRKSSRRSSEETEVSSGSERRAAEETSIQLSPQIESEDSLVQTVSIEEAGASFDVPSPPSKTGSKTQDLSTECRQMDEFDNLSSTISDISLSQATEQLTPSYSDSEACKSDQEQSQREDFQSHHDSSKEEYSEVNQMTEKDSEEQSEDRFTISHSEEDGNHDHEPDYSSDPRTPTSGSLADGAPLCMEEDEHVATLDPTEDPSVVHEELKSASKPSTPRKSSTDQDERLTPKPQTTRRQSTKDPDPVTTDHVPTTRKERKCRSSKKSSGRSTADPQVSRSRSSADESKAHKVIPNEATDVQPASYQPEEDQHLSSSTVASSYQGEATAQDQRHRNHHTSNGSSTREADTSSARVDPLQLESSVDPGDRRKSKSAARLAQRRLAETRRLLLLRKYPEETISSDEPDVQQKIAVDLPIDQQHGLPIESSGCSSQEAEAFSASPRTSAEETSIQSSRQIESDRTSCEELSYSSEVKPTPDQEIENEPTRFPRVTISSDRSQSQATEQITPNESDRKTHKSKKERKHRKLGSSKPHSRRSNHEADLPSSQSTDDQESLPWSDQMELVSSPDHQVPISDSELSSARELENDRTSGFRTPEYDSDVTAEEPPAVHPSASPALIAAAARIASAAAQMAVVSANLVANINAVVAQFTVVSAEVGSAMAEFSAALAASALARSAPTPTPKPASKKRAKTDKKSQRRQADRKIPEEPRPELPKRPPSPVPQKQPTPVQPNTSRTPLTAREYKPIPQCVDRLSSDSSDELPNDAPRKEPRPEPPARSPSPVPQKQPSPVQPNTSRTPLTAREYKPIPQCVDRLSSDSSDELPNDAPRKEPRPEPPTRSPSPVPQKEQTPAQPNTSRTPKTTRKYKPIARSLDELSTDSSDDLPDDEPERDLPDSKEKAAYAEFDRIMEKRRKLLTGEDDESNPEPARSQTPTRVHRELKPSDEPDTPMPDNDEDQYYQDAEPQRESTADMTSENQHPVTPTENPSLPVPAQRVFKLNPLTIQSFAPCKSLPDTILPTNEFKKFVRYGFQFRCLRQKYVRMRHMRKPTVEERKLKTIHLRPDLVEIFNEFYSYENQCDRAFCYVYDSDLEEKSPSAGPPEEG